MSDFFQSMQTIFDVIKNNTHTVLYFMAILWVLNFINALLGYRLNIFGIYPRKPFGLIGIVFAPFLHGNFNHLFFNSIPLFFLMNFVLMYGLDAFYQVSAIIIIGSGFAVWLFGRPGLHVGASGVIMGYCSFLLTMALVHQTTLSIVIGLVTLYYFGGLLFDLLPKEVKTSWEGHVFGFISGIGAAYYIILG